MAFLAALSILLATLFWCVHMLTVNLVYLRLAKAQFRFAVKRAEPEAVRRCQENLRNTHKEIRRLGCVLIADVFVLALVLRVVNGGQ